MILVTLLALASPQSVIQVDAGRGNVDVHLPAGYDPSEPVPLILGLHGWGSLGFLAGLRMQLPDHQATFGYAYCTPTGNTTLSNGNPTTSFWNATDACCNPAGNPVAPDDSGYLRTLIEEIEANVSIDPRSIHVFGNSNGGFMAHRLACDHPDKIASIVSINSATHDDQANCPAQTSTPAGPVHLLHIHGTDDNVVHFSGGTTPFGGTQPGAMVTVQRWADTAMCNLTPVFLPNALNLDDQLPPMMGALNETHITRFESGCSSGGSAELWEVEGLGHGYPSGFLYQELAIAHALARPKPGVNQNTYCSPAVANSTGSAATMYGSG